MTVHTIVRSQSHGGIGEEIKFLGFIPSSRKRMDPLIKYCHPSIHGVCSNYSTLNWTDISVLCAQVKNCFSLQVPNSNLRKMQNVFLMWMFLYNCTYSIYNLHFRASFSKSNQVSVSLDLGLSPGLELTTSATFQYTQVRLITGTAVGSYKEIYVV